jgi:HEAT repeat protein
MCIKKWHIFLAILFFWGINLSIAQTSNSNKRLIKALSSSNYKVRLQAVIMVGKKKISRGIPGLRKLLANKKEKNSIRAAAAISLGQLDDQKSRKHCAELLGHRVSLVSLAAEKALVMLDKNRKKPAYYLVAIGKLKAKKSTPKTHQETLKKTISNRLKRTSGIQTAAGEDKALKKSRLAAHLKKRKLIGMLFLPKLTQLKTVEEYDRTSITCQVEILVLKLDTGKLEFSSGGEASSWIEGTNINPFELDDITAEVIKSATDTATIQALQYLSGREAEPIYSKK